MWVCVRRLPISGRRGRPVALRSEAAICQLTLGRHGNQNALRQVQSVPPQAMPGRTLPLPAYLLAKGPTVNLIRAVLMADGRPPNQTASQAKKPAAEEQASVQVIDVTFTPPPLGLRTEPPAPCPLPLNKLQSAVEALGRDERKRRAP
ncbi:hypothetical protein KUCAC02_001754, partial [Chaenocephalus aceratus]